MRQKPPSVGKQPTGVEHIIRVERPLDLPHQLDVAAGVGRPGAAEGLRCDWADGDPGIGNVALAHERDDAARSGGGSAMIIRTDVVVRRKLRDIWVDRDPVGMVLASKRGDGGKG